jgi:hypothetical protein
MATNYVDIDQRYNWLAGMFNTTLHIPFGASETLGTGGATEAGGLFFRTTDNTLLIWNGTLWVTLGVIPPFQQNGVLIGGTVTWLQNYDYEVSESFYYINSILYHSPVTTVTLTAADATDDRIDLFVLTTSNTADKVTGTASTPPAEPNYDPATQLKISFALVENGTTEPVVTQDYLYRENAGTPTEWAYTDNSANLNPASTNNPFAGTLDIEGTTVGSGNSFTLTDTASPNFALYDALVFKIRSKAAWSTRVIGIRWYNGTTALGNLVLFGNGSFGFDSSQITTYQNINIPISTFGAIAGADRVTFQRMTGGGTIGFYIDDIQLMLTNSTPPSPTPAQALANTSDATSHTVSLTGSSTSVKIVEGTGITLTTTGTGNNGIVTIASSATTPGIDSVLAVAQSLTANRSITTTASFALTVNSTVPPGTANGGLIVNNTDTFGVAIYGTADAGYAIIGTSSGGPGVAGRSTNGVGLEGSSTSGSGVSTQSVNGLGGDLTVIPSSTNTAVSVLDLNRLTSGTAADGIAGILRFKISTTTSTRIANYITSKLTTAADGSRVSQLIIGGVDNAVDADLLFLDGDGRLRLVGRLQTVQGADVASVAGAIALGLDGNHFELTGTNAVTLISNVGWVNGNEVTLWFTSTASLTDGTANSGTDIGMELAGNVNFSGSAGASLTLCLIEIGGTQRWREKCRSVN